jgi:hypothetical protein
MGLFPLFIINEMSFVGEIDASTNFISTFFMDLAGNPHGTYSQEEVCIHCGKKLKNPPQRTLLQKVFTRVAFKMRTSLKPFYKAHPNWIHLLFKKNKGITHYES